MKDNKFYKYSLRGIVALLCAGLISSCAYESYAPNHYPTTNTNRGTGNSAAPVLVGAAAIGALVLAKRYNDKHKNDHYNHHRYGSRYGHGYRSGYGSHRPYYSPQRKVHYRTHSNHRRHNTHVNHNRNRHNREHINHDRGNRSDRGDRGNRENRGNRGQDGNRGGNDRGGRANGNGVIANNTPVRVLTSVSRQGVMPSAATG